MNDFYKKVYHLTSLIPYGRVTTYGAIAAVAGSRSSARMVGYALNHSINAKHDRPLPAHRVVNRLGQLTGRGAFPDDSMREMLKQEGIPFKDDYTVDLDDCFWDPQEIENL